jgi:hypothetical protein
MASRHPLPILARTVADIVAGTNPVAARIRDRSFRLSTEFINDVTSLLLIGFPGRRPRSLVDSKGRPRPTDMDLASFLVHLIEKATVVELPDYETLLPKETRAGEHHLTTTRYGEVTKLVSHREHLSFGVRLKDMSVMERSPTENDKLGVERSFAIVAHDGTWHQGWHGISWQFREDEVGFRERYSLLADKNHRGYLYFAHPNRRHSIFSRAHLLLKLLWQRLDDEINHWSVHLPDETTPEAPAVTKRERGKHVLVPIFVMKLTGLPLTGEYDELADDTGEMVRSLVHFLTEARTKVQFLVRVNEFAFYQYGREKDYVAHWIKSGVWHHFADTDAYRQRASLTLAPGVALGYTVNMVSKKVAAR